MTGNVRKLSAVRALEAAAALGIDTGRDPVPAVLAVEDDEPEEAAAPEVEARPQTMPELWAKFRPLFVQAIEPQPHLFTIERIEAEVLAREVQFWPGRNAAMIARVNEFPGGAKVLQIEWGCGDVPELIGMLPGIEAYGRLMGCVSVLVEGRAAWARVLKGSGFKPWSVTVCKEL